MESHGKVMEFRFQGFVGTLICMFLLLVTMKFILLSEEGAQFFLDEEEGEEEGGEGVHVSMIKWFINTTSFNFDNNGVYQAKENGNFAKRKTISLQA